MIALACLGTLVCGAAYEACSVGWVHNSERGHAGRTALFSMLQATAQVVGIGESVHDLRTAPFFVAGWDLGSFLAVRLKSA